MKVSVISHSLGHETQAIAGMLTAEHLHQVAEAFIKDSDTGQLGAELTATFGRWRFRSYVLDLSGPRRARITYSVRAKPDLVYFRGGPIAIAECHAAKFELYVTTGEARVLPKPSPSPHFFDAGARP